jgi:beta-mannosidase
VASTNNQFRQYYFDISSILDTCSGIPILSINFGSAPNITANIASKPGQEKWPPYVIQVYDIQNRQFMRKEQSDFAWDWGPAFAPAGIWQPAFLIQLPQSELYIRNSLIDIHRKGQLNNLPPDQTQPWVVDVSIDILGALLSDTTLAIEIIDVGGSTMVSANLKNIIISDNTIGGSITIDGSICQLWWPSGMGAQTLYYFKIDLIHKGNVLASVTKRSGFRTIVLNMTPISDEQLAQGIAPGNNWHFEVNGHEFYAKGSNLIPPDAFWPRVTETKMTHLFQSVIDGNQNMLRVWAGGES